ncbi:MAG TPA: acetate--CoA ligase family protein [Jatrophihabitantaceae bacterium]|jgi:acyl-CoA synthetase (NDP forming)
MSLAASGQVPLASPTEGSRPSLEAFLSPASIAVVGVSASGRGLGAATLRTLRKFGYAGDVVAINPKADMIGDVQCYPSLVDVPHRVDLVLLFTSGDQIVTSVEQAAQAGAGAAVVFASGFAELGFQGRVREQEILRIARESNLRILGPNCQGIVNVHHQLAGTFSNALWARRFGEPMPVAYVGQSGAVGGSVFDLGRERGFMPAVWMSTGNQMDVGVVECTRYLLEKPQLNVFVLYIEQVPEYGEWHDLCSRAHDLGKKIVVLKSGQSDAGRIAIASHTGAITGTSEAFDIVSEHFGVVLASDVNELVDVAMLWTEGVRRPASRLGIITTSGGMGSVMADLASQTALEVVALGPSTIAQLTGRLSAFATPQNPVDVTADLVASRPHDFGEVCRAVAEDANVDVVVVLLSAVVGGVARAIAEALVAARASSSTPFVVVYVSSHDRTGDVRAILAEAHLPVFDSVGDAVRALGITASDPHAPWAAAHTVTAHARPRTTVVTESEAAAVLEEAGIDIPDGRLATSRDTAVQIARELGGPLVLKVQSPDVLHKSDLGLVMVDMDPADVGASYDELLARVASSAPGARVLGVLVQRRARVGTELLVGVQAQPLGYPAVVTVGIGGVGVELYADAASDLLPIDRERAIALLRRLRGWPLLDGFRGGKQVDLNATINAIVATSAIATSLGPRLHEFEINPLIVHQDGDGATAVDFVAHLAPMPDSAPAPEHTGDS